MPLICSLCTNREDAVGLLADWNLGKVGGASFISSFAYNLFLSTNSENLFLHSQLTFFFFFKTRRQLCLNEYACRAQLLVCSIGPFH